MNETLATCLTQIITTLLTIGASILIAYLTYRSQLTKSTNEVNRLQEVNRDAAFELFYVYLANLAYFVSVQPVTLNKEEAILRCKKMLITEQHLAGLTDFNLPDDFIKDFQISRLKAALFRISLEDKLAGIPSEIFSSELLSNLEPAKLSQELTYFINNHKKSS